MANLDLSATDIALGAGMFILMFGMGLTLSLADFRRIATSPRATIVGTVLQLLIMPVVGLALANYFELSPILSTGILVVAACPGGMFSNMFVHFAGGNTALSVTLTATATFITLFTLPLWVRFAITTFSAGDAATIVMPILETALRLSTLTILPIVIGMICRARMPELANWERRFTMSGVLLIGVSVAFEGGSQPDIPIDEFITSIAPAFAFAIAAMAIGCLVPTLFRIPARETVTIAVELVVKNTLLGIVLVGQALDFEAVLPIFAFAAFQTPGGLTLLAGWRFLKRRGAFKSDAAHPQQSAP